MDILIVLISLSFIGLVGVFAYQSYEDRRSKNRAVPKESRKEAQPDLNFQYRRKLADSDEKIKKIEFDYEACRLELTQTKEREKALANEKSQIKFDAEQYEKFKKEFQTSKQELASKEEALEKEISSRRSQESELNRLKQDSDSLRKKLSESEDALRKSLTLAENLTKELTLAKKTIEEQKKIVREHSENKMGGEWVSRAEFEKVEKELKEKESLIQKYLALKKETDGHT